MFDKVIDKGATIANLAGTSTAFKSAKAEKGVYDALTWTEDTTNKAAIDKTKADVIYYMSIYKASVAPYQYAKD